MSSVVITQNDKIELAIAEALRHVPLEKLVRGKFVAIKPNETGASRKDTTGVTQPDTLRAVLRAEEARGQRRGGRGRDRRGLPDLRDDGRR